MGKKGGSNRLKIQSAPPFWEIPRKTRRFVLKPIPGPHAIDRCYPLGILLRDILSIAHTKHEVEEILNQGSVLVDSVKRYDIHFPVGLMDTIELPNINKTYRLVPKDGVDLRPIEITHEEKNLKLCKIIRKQKVNGNRLQYTLHDGRNILHDNRFSTHDTLLIKVPEQEIVSHINMQSNTVVLVSSGVNVGLMGRVVEIKEGTYLLPRRVLIEGITDDEGSEGRKKRIELPMDMLIAVGVDKPLIRVS
jgi:small subunit ribosomal protein S4e